MQLLGSRRFKPGFERPKRQEGSHTLQTWLIYCMWYPYFLHPRIEDWTIVSLPSSVVCDIKNTWLHYSMSLLLFWSSFSAGWTVANLSSDKYYHSLSRYSKRNEIVFFFHLLHSLQLDRSNASDGGRFENPTKYPWEWLQIRLNFDVVQHATTISTIRTGDCPRNHLCRLYCSQLLNQLQFDMFPHPWNKELLVDTEERKRGVLQWWAHWLMCIQYITL